MHRLLKLRSLSLQQIELVSKSTLSNNHNIQYRERSSCDLCKQSRSAPLGKAVFINIFNIKYYVLYFLVSLVRNQSTHTNPIIQVSTKRRRTKKSRNYAEILEGIFFFFIVNVLSISD